MTLTQQVLDLLLCDIACVLRDSRDHEEAKPSVARELLLVRGVGNEDLVVLIVAHGSGLPLDGQHAQYFEGKVLDANDLSSRIGSPEEVLAHGLADNSDICCGLNIFGA